MQKSHPDPIISLRLYRRDEDSKVIKEDAHLQDAERYLVMSGIDRMTTAPVERDQEKYEWPYLYTNERSGD